MKIDPVPPASREIMFAVAPGKLKALIDGYGLASSDVAYEVPADARETDLFSTYIANIGTKTGRKRSEKCRRSQHATEVSIDK